MYLKPKPSFYALKQNNSKNGFQEFYSNIGVYIGV